MSSFQSYFNNIHVDLSFNVLHLILNGTIFNGAWMINVPNSYVNCATIFTISHITNQACLIHIKHTFDIRNNMGMENNTALEKLLFIWRR